MTRRPTAAPAAAVGVAAALAVAACSSSGGSHASASTPPSSGGTAPAAARSADAVAANLPASACPTAYRPPDPQRPAITLRFDLAADHGSATGHEHVVFTPDLPVTELVFRLIANGQELGRAGSALRVTGTSVDGSRRAVYEADGARAGTQGSVVRLPLPHRVAAGTPITADLDFTLTIGRVSFDRYGHDAGVAWWGSGHPLLAWVDGHGWATEPTSARSAEIATSEAASTDLTVTAPAADTVLMTGTQDAPRTVAGGRRRWHSTAAAARDVAVMAGRLKVASGRAGSVPITVGVAPGVNEDPATELADVRRAVLGHAARFGPYPYSALVAAALPGIGGGGVEYPGAVMLGDGNLRPVASHEVGHMWFYGMVGDDQARDPWLDEAFATYAAAVLDGNVDGIPLTAYQRLLAAPLPVDSPVSAFADDNDYVLTVYAKGAAALYGARIAAGAARFDAALRCYAAANAWRIATPADVGTAVDGLPAAAAVLRKAGAIPG